MYIINSKISTYYRLFRLHQPAGIGPLFWPCIWAITLSSKFLPNIKLIFIFLLGSIMMRTVGCIINDIVDRDYDIRVTRTKSRPIACGEITVVQAVIVCLLLLILSLTLIVFTLNKTAIMIAISSIILVIIYPFMKRITYWPQAFLGLTFNWGVLVGWAAVTERLTLVTLILYIACICWTLGYDTIYAHQDKEDDVEVGIKSTALKFGENTKIWLTFFYTTLSIGLILVGYLSKLGSAYYLGLLVAIYHLYWQVKTVDINNVSNCREKFISNIGFGAIVSLAMIAGKFYDHTYY